jgi:hypothetical protein
MDKDAQAELYRLGAQIVALETMFSHVIGHLMEQGRVLPDLIRDALRDSIASLQRATEIKGGNTVFDVQTARATDVIRQHMQSYGFDKEANDEAPAL